MPVHPSPRFLSRLLWIDAASCLACGLLQLGTPSLLPALTGLPAVLLLESGIFLLLYGAALLWLARRESVPATVVRLLVAGNLGWAAACVALMAGPWLQPTPWGHAYLALQALTVLVLAELQWLALRRSRPARPALA